MDQPATRRARRHRPRARHLQAHRHGDGRHDRRDERARAWQHVLVHRRPAAGARRGQARRAPDRDAGPAARDPGGRGQPGESASRARPAATSRSSGRRGRQRTGRGRSGARASLRRGAHGREHARDERDRGHTRDPPAPRRERPGPDHRVERERDEGRNRAVHGGRDDRPSAEADRSGGAVRHARALRRRERGARRTAGARSRPRRRKPRRRRRRWPGRRR